MNSEYWVTQAPSGWFEVRVQTTAENGKVYGPVSAAEFSSKDVAERFRDRLAEWEITSGEVLVIQSFAAVRTSS